MPEQVPDVWADRRLLHEAFSQVLSDFLQNRRSVVQCIWGYFGAGKSHTLLHFRRLAGRDHFFLYGKLPKQIRSFLDLYKQGLIGLIDFLEFSQITKEICASVGDEKRFFDLAYRELSENWFDFAQVISILGRTTWTVDFPSDPYFALCRAWIFGERLGKRELKLIGITRNIDNDQDAVRAFRALLSVLTMTTKSQTARGAVVLALDDCQFFVELRDSDRRSIQQQLKDVLEGFPQNLCLVMSFTANDAKKMRSILIQDILSRMNRAPIHISELTKPESVEFIEELVSADKFRTHDAPDRFYPYTRESISKIVEFADKADDLTPRNLMIHFDGLTSAAERDLFPNRIDVDFVKEYYSAPRTTSR